LGWRIEPYFIPEEQWRVIASPPIIRSCESGWEQCPAVWTDTPGVITLNMRWWSDISLIGRGTAQHRCLSLVSQGHCNLDGR
jgi:hypothetical protein